MVKKVSSCISSSSVIHMLAREGKCITIPSITLFYDLYDQLIFILFKCSLRSFRALRSIEQFELKNFIFNFKFVFL